MKDGCFGRFSELLLSEANQNEFIVLTILWRFDENLQYNTFEFNFQGNNIKLNRLRLHRSGGESVETFDFIESNGEWKISIENKGLAEDFYLGSNKLEFHPWTFPLYQNS